MVEDEFYSLEIVLIENGLFSRGCRTTVVDDHRNQCSSLPRKYPPQALLPLR